MNEKKHTMSILNFLKDNKVTLLIIFACIIIVSALLWYKLIYIKSENIPNDNISEEVPDTGNKENNSQQTKKEYKVTYINNNRVDYVKYVKEGEKTFKYGESSAEGFAFIGWYLGDKKFDFETPITSDINLTAKYISKKEAAISVFYDNSYFSLEEIMASGKIVDSFNGIDLIASTYTGKEELYINYPREYIGITSINEQDDANYYVIDDSEFSKTTDNFYIIDYENQKFLVKKSFEDVSCYYHSDVSFSSCNGGETTIVKKDGKYGLLSLKTGKNILDIKYDKISARSYDNNYLLVTNNGKVGIYSIDGNLIWNFDNDFIYRFSLNNDELTYHGFFTAKKDIITFYDNNLNPLSLSDILSKIQNKNLYLDTTEGFGDGGTVISYTDFQSLDKLGIKGLQYKGNKYMGKYYILCDLDNDIYNTNEPYFYVLDIETSKFIAVPNEDFIIN